MPKPETLIFEPKVRERIKEVIERLNRLIEFMKSVEEQLKKAKEERRKLEDDLEEVLGIVGKAGTYLVDLRDRVYRVTSSYYKAPISYQKLYERAREKMPIQVLRQLDEYEKQLEEAAATIRRIVVTEVKREGSYRVAGLWDSLARYWDKLKDKVREYVGKFKGILSRVFDLLGPVESFVSELESISERVESEGVVGDEEVRLVARKLFKKRYSNVYFINEKKAVVNRAIVTAKYPEILVKRVSRRLEAYGFSPEEVSTVVGKAVLGDVGYPSGWERVGKLVEKSGLIDNAKSFVWLLFGNGYRLKRVAQESVEVEDVVDAVQESAEEVEEKVEEVGDLVTEYVEKRLDALINALTELVDIDKDELVDLIEQFTEEREEVNG